MGTTGEESVVVPSGLHALSVITAPTHRTAIGIFLVMATATFDEEVSLRFVSTSIGGRVSLLAGGFSHNAFAEK